MRRGASQGEGAVAPPVQLEPILVVEAQLRILLLLPEKAIADGQRVDVRAHEAAKGVFGRAHDRLAAHVGAGVASEPPAREVQFVSRDLRESIRNGSRRRTRIISAVGSTPGAARADAKQRPRERRAPAPTSAALGRTPSASLRRVRKTRRTPRRTSDPTRAPHRPDRSARASHPSLRLTNRASARQCAPRAPRDQSATRPGPRRRIVGPALRSRRERSSTTAAALASPL